MWHQLTSSFVTRSNGQTLQDAVRLCTGADDAVMHKLQWLGIFTEKKLDINEGTPAMALQKLIEEKWKLEVDDKDMIVMWHRFIYELNGQKHEMQSSLVSIGEDPIYTAMSATVGLPMAIAAKLILQEQIKLAGVQLPVMREVYEPVMRELNQLGINFNEKSTTLN
ncbi:MAG: saccharopine dehydrogenase C-terminal domain-containing protein, partial [Flavobacteriales bacterium]